MLRQAADVVMRLDDMGLAGLAAGRLDHVGIDGALRQPLHMAAARGCDLGRFLVEDLDEQAADDLALRLRVGHAFQRGEVAIGCIDANHLDAHVLGHGGHHLVAFLPAQQAGIDEHAGELLADGLVQQRRDHRRIHAAGQPQQHMIVADLRAHARDLRPR